MTNNLIIQNISTAVIIISMIIALVKSFFGYKLQRFFSSLSGFAIGAVLGAITVALVFPKNEFYLTALLVGLLLIGVVGAIVGFTFYKVGVFIYMFTTTFSLVFSLLISIFENNAAAAEDGVFLLNSKLLRGDFSNINWGFLLAALAASIIVGIITIKYIKNIIIFMTSVSGGVDFSTSLLVSVIGFNNLFVILLVAAAIAVLGVTFQYRTTRTHGRR